jgi:Tol biopolymer transport system component
MKRIGDIWTEPSLVPYTNAIFSTDGKRLYVGSSKEGDDPYFVEKQGNSWSKPKKVNIVTNFPEIRFVYFPSIASNGTLYFMGYASGLWINIGMYRTELKNGEYTKPELLPSSINLPGNIRNWTPFIAPDESYLIFCSTRGLPKSDQGDLFICFRLPDSNWTEPISMGEPINTNQLERFPAVSPDGMYLFFTRDSQEYDEDVYWVSSRIIDKLKAKAILEHRVKQ